MELWAMLIFTILWLLLFFSIVGMIQCDNLWKLVIRVFRCLRPIQEEVQDGFGVSFHHGTYRENDLPEGVLLRNVVSDSHISHQNTETCNWL